ncbi:MAG: aminopeptidase, partial [Eubacteriales bacterium]
MNKTTLQNYAKLIATVGANVQPGQDVNIEAGLDQPEFIYMLVEECYAAGARKVAVDFRYPELTRLHVASQELETLSQMEDWELARWEHKVQTLPCRIFIDSDDPDGLAGIDQEKYAKALQSKQRQIKPFRNRMDSKYQWCIAAVPGLKWAKKLFQEQDDETAMESLWVAILRSARALENPIENRRALNKQMQEKCQWLNSLGIGQLHYYDQNGTDLTVGMMKESRFRGGGQKTLQGYPINANLPSEEVFCSPKKGLAEGIVYSTMPLSYQSQLIENFSIRFEGGKAVEVHAEKNEELL